MLVGTNVIFCVPMDALVCFAAVERCSVERILAELVAASPMLRATLVSVGIEEVAS